MCVLYFGKRKDVLIVCCTDQSGRAKILLSQNWTGSDILESLDISVNITQQIYYDGYRRVNM